MTNGLSAVRLSVGDVKLPFTPLGTSSLFGLLERANVLLGAGTFAHDVTGTPFCPLTGDPDYGP